MRIPGDERGVIVFTGIVQEIGKILGTLPAAGGKKVRIGCTKVLEGLSRGASISVDGACLTVEETGPDFFAAFASEKTLNVSILKSAKSGTPVNLERPVQVGGELGGHMVLGHVDGVGRVTARRQRVGTLEFEISIPQDLSYGIIAEGSIAVNGVSLTVAGSRGGMVRLVIIPLTLAETNLPSLKVGDRVNIEIDVIGKYLYRFTRKDENRTRDEY
jgi:riboflavin synthase